MSELPEKQLRRLQKILSDVETSVAAANELLLSLTGDDGKLIGVPTTVMPASEVSGVVIEGVFNGKEMVGPDGKLHGMSPNYASKSKLVEGDILKLTVDEETGKLIYKQIGPVPRKQVIGTVVRHDGTTYIEANGKEYRVLLASVTYFGLTPGDQVSVIIPADNPDATWAAVDTLM